MHYDARSPAAGPHLVQLSPGKRERGGVRPERPGLREGPGEPPRRGRTAAPPAAASDSAKLLAAAWGQPLVLTTFRSAAASANREACVRAVAQLLPLAMTSSACDQRRQAHPLAPSAAARRPQALTCQPALGVASELIVAAGRHQHSSPTPESAAPEHLLTRRAVPRCGRELVERSSGGSGIRDLRRPRSTTTPSPGNKEGRPDYDLREISWVAIAEGLIRRWWTCTATPTR